MFEDLKKNYSEMPETELNIDENYLKIFEDELNGILGKNLGDKKNIIQNNFVTSDNINVNKIIKDNKQSQIFIPTIKLKNDKKNLELSNSNSNSNFNSDKNKLNKTNIKKPIFKEEINILKNNINMAKKIFKEIENDKTEELKKELSDKIINSNINKDKKLNNVNIKKHIEKKYIEKKYIEKKYIDNIDTEKKHTNKKDIELSEKDILAIKMLIKYLNKF